MASSLLIAFLVIALTSSVMTQAYYTPPSKVPKEVLKALGAKDVEYDPAKEYVDVSHVIMRIYRFYRIKGLLVYDFRVEMGVKIHAPPDSASINPSNKQLIEGGRAGYISVAFAIQVNNKRILLGSPVRIRWYMGVLGLNLYKKIGSSTYVIKESEFQRITAYWKYKKTNVPTLKALDSLIKSYRSGNKKAYYDLNGILVIEGRGVLVENREASDLIYKLAKVTNKANCVGYAGIVMKISKYWGTQVYYRVMAWDYGNLGQLANIDFGTKPPQGWTKPRATTKPSVTKPISSRRATAVSTKPKQQVTTVTDPIVGKEIAIRISLVQQFKTSTQGAGRPKESILSLSFLIHMLPKSISSSGITSKYWLTNVEIHASDKSKEDEMKKMLSSLSGIKTLPFNDVASSVKSMIEGMRSSLRSLGVYNFDEVVIGHRTYASVPAIYVKLRYGGPAYISGAKGKVSFSLVGYYDALLGLPLKVDAMLDVFATDSQGNQIEGHVRAHAIIVKGLEALKLGTKMKSVSVKLASGREVTISFTSRSAEVSDVKVSGRTLTFKISGNGVGTVSIILPPGASVKRVSVDGKSVPYSIVTAAGGSRVLMISMKMSTHSVAIEFSEGVSNAKSATPTVTTVVRSSKVVTTSEARKSVSKPTTVITKPRTTSKVVTKVVTSKVVETSPKPKTVYITKTKPDILEGIMKHVNLTTIIMGIMGLTILALVIALIRRRS